MDEDCAIALEVVGKATVSGPTGEGRSFEMDVDCAMAGLVKTRPLNMDGTSFIFLFLDVVVDRRLRAQVHDDVGLMSRVYC